MKLGQRGIVLLLSVLVATAISGVIALTVLLLSVSANKTAIVNHELHASRHLTHGCGERVLQLIRDNTSLTGSGNMNLDGETCNYEIISNGGQNRDIRVEVDVGGSLTKTKIIIDQINPQINIVTWQEVANF